MYRNAYLVCYTCSDVHVLQEPYVPVAALNVALEVLQHFMQSKQTTVTGAATDENAESNDMTNTGKRKQYEDQEREIGIAERQVRLRKEDLANREKEHEIDTKIHQDEIANREKEREIGLNNLKEFNTLMSNPREDWQQKNENLSARYNARIAEIFFDIQTNRAITSSGASASTTNIPGESSARLNDSPAPAAEPAEGPAGAAEPVEGPARAAEHAEVPAGAAAAAEAPVRAAEPAEGPAGAAAAAEAPARAAEPAEGPAGAAESAEGSAVKRTSYFTCKKTNPDLKIPTNIHFQNKYWRWKIQTKQPVYCKVKFNTMQEAIDSLKRYHDEGVIDKA